MDCRRIEEWILTDYIDARMGEKLKGLIDQHLSRCPDCEEFLINVRKDVISPFKNVPKELPDGFLWAQIKQAIEEKQVRPIGISLVPDLWERLKAAIHIPRPAFALATIVMMIFMVGTTGQLFINNVFVKTDGRDQVEYLSSLMDGPSDLAGNKGNDPQTPIEKYFL